MDHLQRFTAQIRNQLLIILSFTSILIALEWYVIGYFISGNDTLQYTATTVAILTTIVTAAWLAARYLTRPISTVWEAVLHIAPETATSVAPDLKRVHLGRELVTTLVGHIYQIANVAETTAKIGKDKRRDLKTEFIGNNLPLPILVLDKDMNILFANQSLCAYINRSAADTIGQNMYLVLDMLFSNSRTFDDWLNEVRTNQVTATSTWQRVRLGLPDETEKTKMFDLVAYYNKNNPEGFEVILTLFDRSLEYGQDDQSMNFLALAVHELRTPLTLLRGYIDVFEEELGDKLNDEMTDFLRKMKVTAQQLTAFTGNVLNVSKFENDQLILRLREEDWAPLLQAAVNDVALRAKVRGIHLTLKIEPDLPPAGVDGVSIYEVVNNLLDNAIKYSGNSKEIVIRTYKNGNGQIETTIQDFGVGIPQTAMGNIFHKFYRDYRNRSQVGGTGMGLYLSKAIITAHGGNIWVRSKEGQGSTFGFTILPYDQLDQEKKGQTADIVRTAHGWIKNHSMYRR